MEQKRHEKHEMTHWRLLNVQSLGLNKQTKHVLYLGRCVTKNLPKERSKSTHQFNYMSLSCSVEYHIFFFCFLDNFLILILPSSSLLGLWRVRAWFSNTFESSVKKLLLLLSRKLENWWPGCRARSRGITAVRVRASGRLETRTAVRGDWTRRH